MDPRSNEPDWDSMNDDDGLAPRMFGRQRSLVDEGMKGVADPLLSQEPASVLPSYASLMDTDVGQDFSEDKLMNSGNLYSLYLLNSDSTTDILSLGENGAHTPSMVLDEGIHIKKEISDDEEIDVENDSAGGGHNEVASPRRKRKASQSQENGEKASDALFEGMPFYELQGKEVGPCAYCNMWRTIRYMSYCARYPFCSVNCTKKFAVYKRETGELLEKVHEDDKPAKKLKVPTLFEEHKPRPLFPTTPKHKSTCNGIHGNVKPDTLQKFSWPSYLDEQNSEAAPVRCFHHTALSKEWKANLIGALVEVHNRDPGDPKDCFWVARIIRVAGYKARLRFEGYGMDNSHDFWVHLCKTECYPISGAVKAGMKLQPPKGVLERLGDTWQEHLARISHSGSPTFSLPQDKVKECFDSPFKRDMKLEVVYKRQVSSTCVATVKTVIGDRIHVQYDNCKDPSKDFWFHCKSPLIHPVGWSQRVGHPLVATAAYKSEALDKGRQRRSGPHDAPWELFYFPQPVKQEQSFRVGMKLEVIDPLKLSHICIGTVMQMLDEGYLMIGVDGCLADQNSWFCYHSNSSSLLPVGFCEYHHIDLVPPKDFQGHFDWDDYLRNTNSVAAPVELFHQKVTNPIFKVGQKLEAVDLIESGLICAATIVKIAGPLLRVHFDGWDSSYDQWIDSQSPDIYPVGWCEMVGYPLQPPRVNALLEYTAPVPVFKHNGKKIKISPGLRPDNKKRRSLSISFGHFAVGKQQDLDSVYSFSDDEGMSGYQQLMKPPINKPLPVKKKEKEKKPSKHHHKNHHHLKHNGKSGSELKLKHLLTTFNMNSSAIASQSSVTSPSTTKSVLAPFTSTKKHKKSKSSKKDRECKLSKVEAGILDEIFAAMNKEAELYSKLNGESPSDTRPSKTSLEDSSRFSIDRSSQIKKEKVRPEESLTIPTLNALTPGANSVKTVMNGSILHEEKPSPIEGFSSLKWQPLKPELTPPTLNKMQDVGVEQLLSPVTSDGFTEMPPLIPVSDQDPSSVPDSTTNQFQNAFLLQLAESLKASKAAKSDKNAKAKPKKSRSKDKNKDLSKKVAKKEGKGVKSKKEGKPKSQKKASPSHPPKQRTSHLAELLRRPGTLDLAKVDPKKMVNGFYVAGVSSGDTAPESSKSERVLPNLVPNSVGVIPSSQPESMSTNMLPSHVGVPTSSQPENTTQNVFPSRVGALPSSQTQNKFPSQVGAPAWSQPDSMTQNITTSRVGAPTMSQPQTMVYNALPNHVGAITTSPQPFGASSFVSNVSKSPLASPRMMHTMQRHQAADLEEKPTLLPQPMKLQHLDSKHMSSGVVNFDSMMDDDILQNCIDPNLLHKPSFRGQRSNSMDVGMLQRETNTSQESFAVEDVYQFLPNLSETEKPNAAISKDSKKKAGSNKSKAKPKAKPKPKKKKVSNPSNKPLPRGRSNSFPTSMEVQIPNGIRPEMMQRVISPRDRSNHDTLLELERTQHHIVSSILHDHAHQAAPPEQLLQRQRAAMIMQEKFRELQQLQIRMQMSQQQKQAKTSMPPLVELRRPPIHMGFGGPQHALFNSSEQQYTGQQMHTMPVSPAASMMSDMEHSLTSPHYAQPMMSPSPQASLPPQSPNQVPSPQMSGMHSKIPASPKSMMAPSPKGIILVPSPKSMSVPSPKSMPPCSPTSMPPPSPQSGPPSSSSMVPASPTSMMPPSPQPNLQARLQQTSPMLPSPQSNLQARLQQTSPMPSSPHTNLLARLQQTSPMLPSPQSNLQARLQQTSPMLPSPQSNLQVRLQQTSPIPGPTSPIMMMQGRPMAPGIAPNQRMMTMIPGVAPNQRMMTMPPGVAPDQRMMNRMQSSPIIPHGMPGNGMMTSQPMMSPRGSHVMSPPTRFPSGFGGPIPPGHVPNQYPYHQVPSPQSSPTGPPNQRLPPLHALLRHQMPQSPHGVPRSPHGMSSSSIPSPTSSHTSPQQSPHASPNNMHLQQQSPVFHRGPQYPVSPGKPGQMVDHRLPMNQHFQPNAPMHSMTRPGGFPVHMGFPSPPPGYHPHPSSNASIPRMSLNSPVSQMSDSATDLHHSPRKPSVGILNPWEWSISDVIQFIADAGEAGCAEPFRRQKIDGPKFMSLSKDQLANLTGMKVAPSLKIYQQIVRLRSLFPSREQGAAEQQN